jgi:hypothetical protein
MVALAAVLAFSLPAMAQDHAGHDHAKTEGGKKAVEHQDETTATVKGEIVDLGCYLGHGATGADHKGCALKCIAGGMPMGLLTSDGELYLLTMSHTNADPFNAAKEMAAETVTVTGPVHSRDGMRSLEVSTIQGPGQGS